MGTHSTGLFLHAAKDLRMETRQLPILNRDEVQVAIRSTTLCGSDLHYYSHFRNGTILVREPLCLGHESAGEVIALGADVTLTNPNIRVGDAVALEVGVPCGKCHLCKTERYNICAELRFRSSGSKFPHYQGTLQERINHPVKWVHKLPAELDYETGALLEPLAVAIQAVRRAELCTDPSMRSTCLIFGAGAVGLLTAVAAQAVGMENIVMADVHQGRLEFAKDNEFATSVYTVQPQKTSSIDEMMDLAKATAREVGEMRWPDNTPICKVDIAFECTGIASCVQASIYATKSGGSVVMAGLGTPNVTIPLSEATAREITLVPTWRYAHSYPKAIGVAAASVSGTAYKGRKLPNIRHLITHRYDGLEFVEAAFKTAGSAGDEKERVIVKTAINFP